MSQCQVTASTFAQGNLSKGVPTPQPQSKVPGQNVGPTLQCIVGSLKGIASLQYQYSGSVKLEGERNAHCLVKPWKGHNLISWFPNADLTPSTISHDKSLESCKLASSLHRFKGRPAVLTLETETQVTPDCWDGGLIGRGRGMPRSNQQKDSNCQNSCFHFSLQQFWSLDGPSVKPSL